MFLQDISAKERKEYNKVKLTFDNKSALSNAENINILSYLESVKEYYFLEAFDVSGLMRLIVSEQQLCHFRQEQCSRTALQELLIFQLIGKTDEGFHSAPKFLMKSMLSSRTF